MISVKATETGQADDVVPQPARVVGSGQPADQGAEERRTAGWLELQDRRSDIATRQHKRLLGLGADGHLRRPLRDYYPSRVLLEDHVRRRVLAIPNVTILDGREVVELTSTTERDRVTGAVVADRTTEEKNALTAALVVDATGRGSRTPVFLDRLGYGRPHEDVLAVRISYTSQLLHLPRGGMPAEVIGVFPDPHRPTAFALIGDEGDRSVLSVGSLGVRGPAEQHSEMLSFLAKFAPADVMDALRTAKPIGKASTYRVPSNRRRRYDKMRRTPDGLFVVGDAFCGLIRSTAKA